MFLVKFETTSHLAPYRVKSSRSPLAFQEEGLNSVVTFFVNSTMQNLSCFGFSIVFLHWPDDAVYVIIQENNRSELERFDRERQADFLSMLKGFVTNQVRTVLRPV